MTFRRQDRINLRKKRDGIRTGDGTISNLTEGIPEFRIETDHETGKYKTVQYIKNGLDVVKSEFENVDVIKSSYIANWYLSDEVDITATGGTGVTPCLSIPSNTYLMDIRILVTSTITAGSMDVDIGDGTNADIYIDGWDGSSGSVSLYAILLHGQASSVTESGVKTGKYYADADTLDIDVNTVATNGKIRLLVYLLQQPLDGSVNRFRKET